MLLCTVLLSLRPAGAWLQLTPAWLMAHLLGPPPSGVEGAFAGAYAAIFAAFAAGKYAQSIKDDIGDKSIFECAARFWKSSSLTLLDW